MPNMRIKILKMLRDGEIDIREASQLLDGIEEENPARANRKLSAADTGDAGWKAKIPVGIRSLTSLERTDPQPVLIG